MDKIIVQKVDDWEACYVNGEIYEQCHSLGEGYGLLGFLQELDEKYDFNIREIESTYVGDTPLGEYVNKWGNFPETLKNTDWGGEEKE